MIENFVSKYPSLEVLQVQARNDTLLALLSKHHGTTMRKLHLACTEDVTSDSIVKLLQACPVLVHLSLFFYDGHILDHNLTETIRSVTTLKSLWLGTLPDAVIDPIRIVHDGIQVLKLKELSVKRLEIECPSLVKMEPPLYIQDLENAYELYARGFPKDFILRVREGSRLEWIKVKATDTIGELILQIQNQLNKPLVMNVIVKGKALKKDLRCGDCLKNGSVISVL